jgi:hypothetical protein
MVLQVLTAWSCHASSADNNNLILTMHYYYSPLDFTHQGVEWVKNPPAASSVDWNPAERNIWWSSQKISTTNNTNGLKVQYTSGWAMMLSYHMPTGVQNISKVVITTTTSTTSIQLGVRVSSGKVRGRIVQLKFLGASIAFSTSVLGILTCFSTDFPGGSMDFSKIASYSESQPQPPGRFFCE